MDGTGPPSGPAGATAPARRKARSQVSGASARRLREKNKVQSERPAPEGEEKTAYARSSPASTRSIKATVSASP